MPATADQPEESPRWISCPECEADCRDRPLSPRMALRCKRCGVFVKKQTGVRSLQPAWAIATAGLFFAVLANGNPILTFTVAGNAQSTSIVTGVFSLFDQGYWTVAILVFFAGIAGPFLHLASVWYVAAACCFGQSWPGLRRMAKMAEHMESWNLAPVYVVATVVSAVKLNMLGTVAWQQGALWALALSLCSLLSVQFFDRTLMEKQLEELA
jgi:paraquat-inducible protein A